MTDSPGDEEKGDSPRGTPRSGKGFRRTMYALGVSSFGSTMSTPLYGIYQTQYGFNQGVLTALFGMYAVGAIVALFFIIPLSDQGGRRPFLALGVVCIGVGSAVFILAHNVEELFLARFFIGLGVGACSGAATAALGELEPHRSLHRSALGSEGSNMGGGAIGAFVAGGLVAFAPLPTSLVYLAAIAAVAAGVLVVLFTPESVKDRKRMRFRVQEIRIPSEIRGPFLVTAAALFSTYAVLGLFSSLSGSLLHHVFGLASHLYPGIVAGSLFGLTALALFAFVRIESRTGLTIGPGFCLAALTLLAVSVATQSVLMFLVAVALFGVGVGLMFTACLLIANSIIPREHRGEILSGYYAAAYTGVTIPAFGVGLATDRFGYVTATAAFAVAIGAIVLASLIALRLTPTPPDPR